MKKVVSVMTAAAMALVFATGAMAAEWHPSRTQTGAALARPEVSVTNASGEVSTVDVSNGGILITNVANTLDYSAALEKGVSDKTNVVYQTAMATDSVSKMLAKFSNTEEVSSAIAAQIAKNKEATVSRLTAQRDELTAKVEKLKADGASAEEITAAEQELAQVEARITATEAADYDNMDNYEPAALFDVSVEGDVAQAVADGGSVDVSVKVDGITEESDVLALHFMGDLSDAEAVMEELKTNADATVDEMSVELIPCVPGDGMVTLTMSSFSPVMILTRAEEEVTVTEPAPAETEQAVATPAPAETVEDTQNGGVAAWVYVVIVVAVVVVVGAVVVTRKKKTATAGKK